MKITLIHPSRGRAEQARLTLNHWLRYRSGEHEIEHILSLDNDDPQLAEYRERFKSGSIICAGSNDCVVQATNTAAFLAKGDILIYLSDDFECPANWDDLIIRSVAALGSPDIWLLKVDDCLQKFHVDVLTIPIMSRSLYKRLGYFWHPEYKSMFVDQHLYHTCLNNDWLYLAPDLKFPHLHYSNGKAENDETYRRSSANWNTGKALYHKHKREGFKL